MILDNDQILELIKKPSNANIKQWQEEHTVLDLYYNGGDVASQLEQVQNYENASQKSLRDKIARSTKDFLSNLLNPKNKIFSASGYNVDIEISSQTALTNFKEHLDKLPEGISITKWMETYWNEAYVTDPNGVCFIEVENGQNPKAYPTYKSILTVHDYSLKWGVFDYVIFNYGKVLIDDKKEVKVYRVFDEQKDGLYYNDKEQLKEYIEPNKETSIINHNYGFVPAVLCSDIIDKKTNGRKSFINKIDEVLKEYMRDSSVHSIYKFLHGFPIFWRLTSKCTTCLGTGKITKKETQEKTKCPTCYGTGQKVTNDVSDSINIPIPKDGQPKITPDVAGYVQPDLETWQKQLDELNEMRKEMHFALWGTYTNENVKAETATARFIDEQPIQETLKNISTTAENIEQKLTEFQGKIMYKDLFKKASVRYGKRFLIETPDVLWEKYLHAKDKQSPISTLDYLYKQFLMAEYHNDNAMMQSKLNEFNLEPYPHYSLEDLQGIASIKQIQRKLLFCEWNSLQEVDYSNDFNKLKDDFDKYVNDNLEIPLEASQLN
ncbi:zinc finger-like domain-containing protein [uncultured Wocania sp.]|uniref:zinc finger-like domain-containing protein n=1 Tax=uncultured Wocania sp. TaxID=2834404 RepID=UPI0030F8BDD7